MNSNKIIPLLSAGASALIAVIITALLMAYAMLNIWKTYGDDSISALKLIQQDIEQEVVDYFIPLNEQYTQQLCDNNIVQALSHAEMVSTYLRSYEFSKDNKIQCSSYSGNVSSSEILDRKGEQVSVSKKKISLSGKYPIDISKDQDGRFRMSIGNFHSYLQLNNLMRNQVSWMSQTIIVKDDKEFLHIMGERVYDLLLHRNTTEKKSDYIDGKWVTIQCLNKSTCVAVSVHISDYFVQKSSVQVAMMLVLLIVALLFGAAGWIQGQRYISLNKQISRGLNCTQIQCYYQPIVDMSTDRITGCEVLCRWLTRDGTLVMPDTFISEIEKNKTTKKLTTVVVEKAMKELTDAGIMGDIRVAINTFPDDIASKHIENLLQKHVPSEHAHLITVEITEKEVDNINQVAKNISSLKEHGYQVAIDDFGTGYSNLQHLQNLHVDILKIDKSFIWGVEEQMLRGSLVKNIVDMASALNLKTVAEGVENVTQYQELKALGVHYSQGYLHAKPMPIEEFSMMIRKR